ncbi:hypothetical protein RHGRI_024865 [Rhododendron griersonianum]|uniref:Uncharacterized protein n=1 Tax=Rhododendron griersonianum TaxID=479676 RepID=A0AAV6JB16_9ERIC|nr:hypothetical protein RHGRI_024865 [Rhododendron griersonianum]
MREFGTSYLGGQAIRERGADKFSRTTAGVIVELTRWVALELTLKLEINVESWLSEKHRLKQRITKCKTTRDEPKAFERRKKRINQNGDREEKRKRDFRACKQFQSIISSQRGSLFCKVVFDPYPTQEFQERRSN